MGPRWASFELTSAFHREMKRVHHACASNQQHWEEPLLGYESEECPEHSEWLPDGFRFPRQGCSEHACGTRGGVRDLGDRSTQSCACNSSAHHASMPRRVFLCTH